ncbi:glycosyltransferase family 4 protein [Aeromicrobium wangtongii]|uniref:glycosyltransferase family 4 protein n=1 Tax=Aeromicrobium wangtongii TaxID=2969247 RepID=UPI002017110C|nr:glycosyltransferase [Aeromicrobium wangtongii]MCL3817855.1 glycosyltransferase [Aeromicrobium wangtongii]
MARTIHAGHPAVTAHGGDLVKILVYPHDLGIGGSQLNAIEIAYEMTRLGHEVLVYGQPGALSARIAELGLEMIESPALGRRPTRSVVQDIGRIVDERDIDIVHGYEWPPGVEGYLACRGRPRTRAVTTVMSMAVAPFLPRSMPLVVGTEQIAATERAAGRTFVSVLEPPVDIVANRPGVAGDLRSARRRWGILEDRPTIVCVTRLARQLKLEGLLTAIDAVRDLHPEHPAQLLIVGDGEAREEVSQRAAEANRAVGYPAVVLTGELDDPRPAYDLADVCIGMGGSALRSMAFAAPLIVQGEGGFFRLLTPDSLPDFLWTGWYGHGQGTPADLTAMLRALLDDPERRAELGRFAHGVVEQRFSLAAAADHQLAIYRSALQMRPADSRVVAEAEAVVDFGRYHLAKRIARVTGRGSTDDFNAKPVARNGPPPPSGATDGAVVYFAGVSWDAVAGTDRHLATALSRQQRVIWIDPPQPWSPRRGRRVPATSQVGTGVLRVHTTCPPGVSRPVLRRFARWLTERRALAAVRRAGSSVSAVVVSSPEQLLPAWDIDAVRVYYETDDFVAGAALLGFSSRYARRCRAANVRRSDVVMGVSADLTAELSGDAHAVTLPNGTNHRHFLATDEAPAPAEITLERPVAGVVGQLNDRLDLGMLEAVADLEVGLLLLGPRHDSSPETRSRLEALLARPNVQWIDRQPFDRLPSFLAGMDVGLTPYTATAFNRSSSPLKSLEYLAAGLPVVSTDLPSARALDTDLVMLASTPVEFAKLTAHAIDQADDPAIRRRRRDFAAGHSWEARADQLRAAIALVKEGAR